MNWTVFSPAYTPFFGYSHLSLTWFIKSTICYVWLCVTFVDLISRQEKVSTYQWNLHKFSTESVLIDVIYLLKTIVKLREKCYDVRYLLMKAMPTLMLVTEYVEGYIQRQIIKLYYNTFLQYYINIFIVPNFSKRFIIFLYDLVPK